MRGLAAVVALWPGLALPQTPVVVSAKPDTVGVTIYRDPRRSVNDALELDYLRGFAVIAETRTIDLPPGRVTIRFEGVASGIAPQTALIFGGPVGEKNRDSALLSERGLIDAFTGQRVILRRTDRVTGKVSEESATIRSATDGVLIQTARGIESYQCSGLAEALLYPGVPRTLSAKPVLSMTTKAQGGGRQTITLIYLTSQFDWQANYIAELNRDGNAIDLFAWLTMASNDDTSFERAEAAAIAGRVNRVEDDDDDDRDDADFDRDFGCEPRSAAIMALVPPPPPPPPAPVYAPAMRMAFAGALEADESAIIVTGTRIARREDLGDLKLYRIPMPVTVAARAQKQVAFLSKPGVKGALLYRSKSDDWESIDLLYRFRNDTASGLGEPLPAGMVALFQSIDGQRMLVGEASIADKTTDEEVDLVFGEARNVTVEDDWPDDGKEGKDGKGRSWEDKILTVKNANPVPIRYEAEFLTADDEDYSRFSTRLEKRPGKAVWAVTVPANGTAVLRFRATEKE